MMDGIFGMITVGCGLYCFYSWYQVKTTRQINKSVFFTKDLEVKQCKDKAAYIAETLQLLAGLGVMTIIYGALDLLNTYVFDLGYGFFVVLGLFLIVLILAAFKAKKLNTKYF